MGNWFTWAVMPFVRKRKRSEDSGPPPPQPAVQPVPEPVDERPQKKNKAPLPKRGTKETNHDQIASPEQVQALKAARELWATQLDGQRDCSIRTISVAKWHPERGLAEVTSVKGKWNLIMGFMKDGCFWLQPEEAVYLVDQAALELYYGGIPLTFQAAVSLLAQCNFSWDRYYTYAHLKRCGYVVSRTSIYRLKRERDARDKAKEAVAKAAQLTPPVAAAPATPAHRNEDSILHDPLPDTAAVAALFDSPPTAAPAEPAPLSFPLSPSPEHSDAQPKSTEVVVPRVPRQLYVAEAHIPGDIAPLTDTRNRDDDIHRQLQVVPRITFRESVLPTAEEPANFASSSVCVDFDVYENNSKYKKSAPGVPSFRVAVCTFAEPVPQLHVLESLTRLAYPAPLKVGVVCSGVVLFNEFMSMRAEK